MASVMRAEETPGHVRTLDSAAAHARMLAYAYERGLLRKEHVKSRRGRCKASNGKKLTAEQEIPTDNGADNGVVAQDQLQNYINERRAPKQRPNHARNGQCDAAEAIPTGDTRTEKGCSYGQEQELQTRPTWQESHGMNEVTHMEAPCTMVYSQSQHLSDNCLSSPVGVAEDVIAMPNGILPRRSTCEYGQGDMVSAMPRFNRQISSGRVSDTRPDAGARTQDTLPDLEFDISCWSRQSSMTPCNPEMQPFKKPAYESLGDMSTMDSLPELDMCWSRQTSSWSRQTSIATPWSRQISNNSNMPQGQNHTVMVAHAPPTPMTAAQTCQMALFAELQAKLLADAQWSNSC